MLNDIETLGRYISLLYRAGSMYFYKNLEKYHIGSGQFSFLAFLAHNEGITQEELSCGLFIDKGTTAKAIKRLEEDGYVERVVDNKDKRAYKVYLTDEGKKLSDYVFQVIHDWNNILTSDFTEEEKKLALNLLRRMFENKKKIIKGERK